MSEVSTFRMYSTYRLIGDHGIAGLLNHSLKWGLMQSVVSSVLCAVSLLSARYPLAMQPLLFFELVWKSIWLIAVAWPPWQAGQIDAAGVDALCALKRKGGIAGIPLYENLEIEGQAESKKMVLLK